MIRSRRSPLALAAALILGASHALAVEPGGEPATSTQPALQPGPQAAPAPGPSTTTSTSTATLAVQREIVLELRNRRISLIENGQVVDSWPVAIGDPSTPTPTGRFSVQNKVLNPQYQSTRSGKVNPTIGPESPLGDRWLGFLESGPNQYGIHGTPSAWAWTVTSRAAVTNGCVRMLHDHVRKLFELVDVGTPVQVRP